MPFRPDPTVLRPTPGFRPDPTVLQSTIGSEPTAPIEYRGYIPESKKSLKRGLLNIQSGIAEEVGSSLKRPRTIRSGSYYGAISSISQQAPGGTADVQGRTLRRYAVKKLKKSQAAELRKATSGPPIRRFLSGTLTEMVPYMGTTAVATAAGGLAGGVAGAAVGTFGAFSIGKAVEGNNHYQDTKQELIDSGMPEAQAEKQARTEGDLVGLVSGAVEALQLSDAIKFAKGTGPEAIQALARVIKNKATKKAIFKAGTKVAVKRLELAAREGIEEAMQELTSQGVGKWGHDGKWNIKDIKRAFKGGVGIGLTFGFGGDVVTGPGAIKRGIAEGVADVAPETAAPAAPAEAATVPPAEGVTAEEAAQAEFFGLDLSDPVDAATKQIKEETVEVSTTPDDPSATSARKADMARDRKLLGLEDLNDPEVQRWSTVLQDAKDRGYEAKAMRLAEEVQNMPRGFTPVESAGVVLYTAKLKNEYDAFREQIDSATGETDKRLLLEEQRRVQQEFDIASKALKTSGTEKGRALAAQKLTIDQDFRLLSVLNRAAVSKQKELNEHQRKIFDRLDTKLKRLTAEVKDLQKQVDAGDTSKVKALERKTFQMEKTQRQINNTIQTLKPTSVWGYIKKPFNVARSIMASTDFSAVLRQGGFIAMAHPVRAAKSVPAMFAAFTSEQKAYKINKKISKRSNAPLYARAKLYIAPLSGDVTAKEEAFMSNWAEKIPIVAGSGRAYTTFLNLLRADSFDAMVAGLAKNGTPTLVEARAIAKFINTATGRGSLGSTMEGAAHGLNTVFFAPRYVASRFQLLAGRPFAGAPWQVKKQVTIEYARYLVGMGVVYALGTAAGGGVEDDPRSSDFGKIKFGNTRLDPLSGLSQATVVLSRFYTGESKSSVTGTITPLTGEDRPIWNQGLPGEALRFGRSKLSPLFAAPIDLRTRENVIGQPITPKEVFLGLITPLSIREIRGAVEEQGVTQGTALGLLAIFGDGLQTYSNKLSASKIISRKAH